MDTKKPQVPREAVELYDSFIHGEINRREFMDGLAKYAVGGLALATLVDALMPNYAAAQQVSKTDERLKSEYVTIPSPQGNGSIKGYLVRPVSVLNNKLPGVVVVHENRGLNPHMEDVARRFALMNFMAFAPDGLTSVGGYPGDDVKGAELFGKVDRNKMTEDFIAATQWLKARPDCSGKVAITGFCFGGGVANTTAVRLGADLAAAAPYYGAAPMAADVPKIKAAMLVHHGALDTRLASAWPDYEKQLTAAGVAHEGHIWPNAVHGFNNDATPERYNKAAAEEAWNLTVGWFNNYARPAAGTA